MPNLDPHIFRAYDIRGKANTQITQEACLLVGHAFGTQLREMYQKDSPTVIVGHDARTHSPSFEQAMVDGLKKAGCKVFRMGQTPSPINYFTICTQKLDGGVQITASHNPAEDNGIKLQIRDAEAYSGDDLQKLRERIEVEDYLDGEGSDEEFDAISPYKKYLKDMFSGIKENLQVVVDSGNGVAGPVYCDVLRSVGCTVTELYTEPDGTFPNHPADPSKWETLAELREKVKEVGADCGFGFDGDGDRVGLIDENGLIRNADEILLLLAKDHLSRTPKAPVVFTVSNSGILQTEIKKWGGKPIMCKVGHSFVEHAMREHSAQLGGEQSGHFFCGEDYFGFDDALIATLRLLIIRSNSDKSFSDLFSEFPKVYQAPERRPDCPDDKKAEVIEKITTHFQKDYPVETMDGARIDFGDGAWAGIRQSNTSPKISICIEARTEEKLKKVENEVLEHIKEYPEVKF